MKSFRKQVQVIALISCSVWQILLLWNYYLQSEENTRSSTYKNTSFRYGPTKQPEEKTISINYKNTSFQYGLTKQSEEKTKSGTYKNARFRYGLTKQVSAETSIHVSKESCIGLEFPGHLVQSDTWSAISGTENAFVFSAYAFKSDGDITVVGVSSTVIFTRLYCQFWQVSRLNFSIQFDVKQASADVYLLPGNHTRSFKYTGALFRCPSPSFAVSYVSLVTSKCNVPLSLLTIQNASSPQSYQRKFTVCLKPLYSEYGAAYELVEWIELNRIFGVEKFTIYNYSSKENIAAVVDHYVNQGLVELVQWNMPISSYQKKQERYGEIHNFGMNIMLQDCFFRNKHYSEFIVNIDKDEFVVPRSKHVTTWSEMMMQLNIDADTYVFRTTNFRKEWNNSNIEFPDQRLANSLGLVTLQKFEREAVILPAGTRTKYFTRTDKDNLLKIHVVKGGSSYIVPVEIGLSHHYRNWDRYNDTSPRVVDETVLRKYGKRLIDHVQGVWKDLTEVKMDIPVSL